MHRFRTTWRQRCSVIALLAGLLAVIAVGWQEPALGQSGTWNAAAGTTSTWSSASNWQGGVVAGGAGNTATFLNSGTAVLDADRTIGSIAAVGTGTLAIAGPGFALTLATGVGTPTLSGTGGNTLGIAATLAGTQGFRKTGTSTLALAVANTFSGAGLLETGTTVLQNVGGLGVVGAGNETVVASGAQLQIQTGGTPVTIAESFSIAGRGNPTNAAVSGGGAIRIVASNVTLTGGITLTGTAEIFPNSSSTLTVAGPVTGTGGFIARGSGAFNVTGNMSHTGWLNRWSGGVGTVTLSGSNSYTGATAIDAGPAQLNNAFALPATTALSVTGPAGLLDLNGFDTTIRTFGWREDGVNSPNQNNSTGGTITDNAATPGTSTITVTSGSFVLGTAINDGASGRAVALRVAAGDMMNIQLANSASTFSGGLTLLNGSGRGTRLNVLDPLVNSGSPGAIASSIFGTGTVTVGLAPADKAQFYMGPGTYTGGVGSTVLNDFVFNTDVGTDAAAGVLLNTTEAIFAGTLVADQASASFATGSIVPSSVAVLTGRVTSTGTGGGLRLVGNGQVPGITVRLANETGSANDYQGPTAVEANTTLALGAADQIPNGAGKGDVSVAGSFTLGGFSDTINGLSGSGSVEAGGGTPVLTVGDGDATASFSGVIGNSSGALALVKIGSGVQSLAAANTFTGPTTVSQGTLQVGDAGALASSPVTVAAGATLAVGPQVAATVPALTNNGLVDVGLGGLTVASGQTAGGIVGGIVAGRDGGGWTGTSGITSSAAAAQSERAVGWLDNGDGSFTVAFAAAGDLNVNGVVDFDDVLLFVSAGLFDTGLPATWIEGDYDYNGVVDFDDVLASVSAGLFDAGPYNAPVGGLAALGAGSFEAGFSGVAAVPEPATWVLAALGAGWLAAATSRKKR